MCLYVRLHFTIDLVKQQRVLVSYIAFDFPKTGDIIKAKLSENSILFSLRNTFKTEVRKLRLEKSKKKQMCAARESNPGRKNGNLA